MDGKMIRGMHRVPLTFLRRTPFHSSSAMAPVGVRHVVGWARRAGQVRWRTTGVGTPCAEETLDHLCGDWRVYQLKRGHRWSLDDMAVAWRASENAPHAQRLLDMGCGVGSVGLLTLWRMGAAARLTAVEVQDVSYRLNQKTLAVNDLGGRVVTHHADLREVALPEESFELVTGSPPYFPVEKAVTSPHPQRAGARMELRGNVYDYCAAARRFLAPKGRFCYAMVAADPRTEDAARVHGLTVLERCDFVFKEGRDPLICTLVCAREEDGPHPPRREMSLTVRAADNEWTPEYLDMKHAMGSPHRAPAAG